MNDHQIKIQNLISEQYNRAEAKLFAELGRQPLGHEVAFLVFQSQMFMLACTMLDEDERISWLENSLTLINGGASMGKMFS